MFKARRTQWALGLALALVLIGPAVAQQITVTTHVEVVAPTHRSHSPKDIVVWLTPAEGSAPVQLTEIPEQHPSLTQKDKSFTPHLLVIQVGTVVDFPNHDPFFHNVFSLFEGKRFDLGLYEAGTTRHVRFDRPGVCYIFCNIHPEMSAVVVVLDTPYYGLANGRGMIEIPRVPAGRYTMHVWDERSLPEDLAQLTREVTVSPEQASLGKLRIRETEVALAHKNKYGQDYEKPAPPEPGYIPQ
jgi:plastocyanin